jgi:hypothetical protein
MGTLPANKLHRVDIDLCLAGMPASLGCTSSCTAGGKEQHGRTQCSSMRGLGMRHVAGVARASLSPLHHSCTVLTLTFAWLRGMPIRPRGPPPKRRGVAAAPEARGGGRQRPEPPTLLLKLVRPCTAVCRRVLPCTAVCCHVPPYAAVCGQQPMWLRKGVLCTRGTEALAPAPPCSTLPVVMTGHYANNVAEFVMRFPAMT